MQVLIFVEHVNGVVAESAFEMAQLAKLADAKCLGFICAENIESIEALAAQLKGFDSVIGVADETVKFYNSDATLTAFNSVVATHNPDLVMTSYSTAGIDLAPGVALHAERPMLGYVTAFELANNSLCATSQIYGGKLLANTSISLPAVMSIMPGAVKVEDFTGTAPTPTIMSIDLSHTRIRVTEIIEPDTSSVNLTDADKIVCIGRALGGTEKLPVAEQLALSLKAEIAGSRPVIDAGWLPKIRQVGKSGTKVKPKLYFMAGVSGAPEHLEGMESSELIIAINSDEQAPIFRKAHYGAVCDMFKLLPALTELIENGG
jgi:electron transfer flavoprotein alpha subunit